MALPKVYDVPEAAAAMKVSEWTVWKWIQTGKIRGTKIGDRRVIRESELERLLKDDDPRK
jgi:excisionase family DNA binding protein